MHMTLSYHRHGELTYETRDIMIAMGQIQRPAFGHEASGIVTRVGPKTTELSCGDRVIFIGPGAMRTHIRAHESCVQRLPDNMSFEQGVSLPIAYATAYRALVEVARLERGESVLIHAAAGGKLMPSKQCSLHHIKHIDR